jgi:hypothetical protein
MKSVTRQEKARLTIQSRLDCVKTSAERNRLGQFATPTELATDILSYAKELLGGKEPVRFLDPAFGTGSFFSALIRVFPRKRIACATGFEIDPHYAEPAASLWRDAHLDLKVTDFTKALAPGNGEPRFNLIICNPPYVRHHHVHAGEKARLQTKTIDACGVSVGGLAGLYCYFLGLSHAWLEKSGIAGWLIPSEFMDVNYGRMVKEYLLSKVTLLRIHRFDPTDVQFGDALVSSAIIWLRNEKPSSNHVVEFTYGGTLKHPKTSGFVSASDLKAARKWTRFPIVSRRTENAGPTLGDSFVIKRGIATGDNKFFILTPDQLRMHGLSQSYFRPILPSPRHLVTDEILADESGNPQIEPRHFLLHCSLPEQVVRKRHPELWQYLEAGVPDVSGRYLCRHRNPWYSQEDRSPAPFLCTYMGRESGNGRPPFRFILNHSKAIAANVYLLMYPRKPLQRAIQHNPELMRKIWQILQGIDTESIIREGRVYGGGLFKMEPKELAAVPAMGIAELLPQRSQGMETQPFLFTR